MQVRVVRRDHQASLVEWIDGEGLHRATVPTAELADNEVSQETLDMGIQYGLPWEGLLRIRVTPEAIAHELRRRGIWTSADLAARPMVALAALQAAYGIDLAALRAAAERHDKEQ